MHGTVCWHELNTTDTKKATSFYKGLFGWSAKKATGLGMPYHYLSHGENGFGGMGPLDKKAKAMPHWLVYIKVDDVEASAKKAAKLGGKLMVPVMDLPMGRIAVVADPSGAAIGLYQPKE